MSSPGVTAETTVNDSHSVTVPSQIRERLDIDPGDNLRWTLGEDGELRVQVVRQRYGAFADLEPKWHGAGVAIVSAIDVGDLPRARLTYYGLPEVLTPIEKRAGGRPAVEILDFLSESRGFDLVYATRHDVARALAIYRRSPGLTFVDSITVAYMQRVGLEYVYSFDDGFDRFDGITRLTTPDDPFA